MRLKMEKNHPLFEFCASFILNFVESPLPVIRLKFDFNKSFDMVFVIIKKTETVKEKINRFFSICKYAIHSFTPINYYYSVGGGRHYCLSNIAGMQKC